MGFFSRKKPTGPVLKCGKQLLPLDDPTDKDYQKTQIELNFINKFITSLVESVKQHKTYPQCLSYLKNINLEAFAHKKGYNKLFTDLAFENNVGDFNRFMFTKITLLHSTLSPVAISKYRGRFMWYLKTHCELTEEEIMHIMAEFPYLWLVPFMVCHPEIPSYEQEPDPNDIDLGKEISERTGIPIDTK